MDLKDTREQTKGLKTLGARKTVYYDNPSVDILETFPNAAPGRDYVAEFNTKEFTSLCPITGQPDYATVSLRYIPDEKCVESKSLKLYLGSFRSTGQFMESITNRMVADFVELLDPRGLVLEMDFAARGGIGTVVTVKHLSEKLTDEHKARVAMELGIATLI